MIRHNNVISPFTNRELFGGAFDPSSLGLDLDLRTPNEALDEDSARSNGLILFRNNFNYSNNDLTAIIDQSQDKALDLADYESDFSVNHDGWQFGGTNVTFTGNQDSIAGEDDWGLLQGTSALGAHYISSVSATSPSQVYFVTVRVFIPLSNSVVDGFGFQTSDGFMCRWPNVTKGSIQTLTGYWYSGIGSERIELLSGTSASFNDAGEGLYIKDISFSPVLGNHFVQETVSKMPHWDNINFTGDFDGVDDVAGLNSTKLAAFKSAYSGDTQGMFSLSFYDDEGSGVALNVFSLGQASGTGLINCILGADDHLYILINDGTYPNNQHDLGAITRGGKLNIQFGSDGSELIVYVNGTLTAVVSSVVDNIGDWMASFASQAWNVFHWGANRAGGVFYASGFEHLFYKSGRVFTQQEVDDINSYFS